MSLKNTSLLLAAPIRFLPWRALADVTRKRLTSWWRRPGGSVPDWILTVLLGLGFALASTAADQPPITVATDHPGAVYAVGESIGWQVAAKGESCSNLLRADYVLKKGGLTPVAQGTLEFTNHVAQLVATTSEPGTLLLEIKARNQDGKNVRALGGAVVAPDRIEPAEPRPKDFEAFWKAEVQELSKVPANPQLVPGDSGRPGVDYWQIAMDNIRGTRIRGQLARPATGQKLPALLIVQWAGVYGLQKSWVIERAAAGWLALNINPHDLPIDQAPEFYDQQSKGPLKDYPGIGNDNRETSYFLRMYLSCYRAAQYLTERADWDGKVLVVTGTSQGGMQTLMTAGLHPRITGAIACVPAGCDLAGPKAGRSPGWPQWFYKTEGKDAARVVEASRYYDVVNFASRIRCPVLVGIGLVDETCPPAGILAAMNQVKAPKEIVLLPHADHQGAYNTHQAFRERERVWLETLVKGEPAPVR